VINSREQLPAIIPDSQRQGGTGRVGGREPIIFSPSCIAVSPFWRTHGTQPLRDHDCETIEGVPQSFADRRDADGDHALNDLLNLMRLALSLRTSEGIDALIIVGRRNHPHQALGWMRGEFESLLNRVLVEAVHFARA
jgi:hypothetical protein